MDQKQSTFPAVNQKYKTIECQDHKSAKGCKCHFAHGSNELRKQSDPLPRIYADQVGQARSNYQEHPYCNYKTIKCKNLHDTGYCKFGQNCKYAHNETELRNPFDPIPQVSQHKNQIAGLAFISSFLQQPPPKFRQAVTKKMAEDAKIQERREVSTADTSSHMTPINKPNMLDLIYDGFSTV